MTGNISYNGYNLKDIVPQKTSAYVSQNDLHIPEMTVRKTLNFSACCQGIGSRAVIMDEVGRKEKEAGVFPDPDIDIFMKAICIEGQKETLQTNYILKILGLDTCADVLVGNAMKRGISGGEKKRLTTGVLTALMGVTGAGKTTLLDVLAGRKTYGTIKGEIKVGGYPKIQETFARISGYCEQTDIHSPQVTVEESVTFSAWLRLHPQINAKTKYKFVKDVIQTVELDGLKDALVGIPGVSGLSTEQRKRLTIAVEEIDLYQFPVG